MEMIAGRLLVTLAATTVLLGGLATPAPAARRAPEDRSVQRKSVNGAGGRAARRPLRRPA